MKRLTPETNALKSLIIHSSGLFSIIIAVLLLAGCLSPSQKQENIRLQFNNSGKFKIAQFTDIHWVHGSPAVARTVESIKAVKTLLRLIPIRDFSIHFSISRM